MTYERRWLDELPFSSLERELLLAGKSARPPSGAVDADWQALCVALSVAPAVGTSDSAAHSASVKASGFVTKAGGAGFLNAAIVKSFAVGAALGLGVAGTSAVVGRWGGHAARPAMAADPTRAPSAQQPSAQQLAPLASEPRGGSAASSASARGEAESFAPSVEPPSAMSSAPPHADLAPAAPTPLADTSLSEQARELAVVKRLLDAGAAAEALRRLQASFGSGASSTLSEERDALYVQALTRAQRRAEARAAAREFLARYPRSPYLETMRRLLADE